MLTNPPDERNEDLETPAWFENIEEPDNESQNQNRWRYVIGIGAFAIIVVLLLIPVLQAEILQRRRNALPDSAYDRTAFQFAAAVHFSRSEGAAMLFADPASRSDVRTVLEEFRDQRVPSSRARLQVRQVPCGDQQGDRCYTSRVFDTAPAFYRGLVFGVERSDESTTVVWVEIDELIAGGYGRKSGTTGHVNT